MDKAQVVRWMETMASNAQKWQVEAQAIDDELIRLLDANGWSQQLASARQRVQGIVFLMNSAMLQFDKTAKSLKKVKMGGVMNTRRIAGELVKIAKSMVG